MLKTIKTTKYLNLHELIKYVWENPEIFFKDFIKETFFTNIFGSVTFYKDVGFMTNTCIDPDELFPVEVEEEITEDTIFQELYSVYYSGDKTFRDIYNDASINGIILEDTKQGIETERIYALYKGKIELIWERDNHGSN